MSNDPTTYSGLERLRTFQESLREGGTFEPVDSPASADTGGIPPFAEFLISGRPFNLGDVRDVTVDEVVEGSGGDERLKASEIQALDDVRTVLRGRKRRSVGLTALALVLMGSVFTKDRVDVNNETNEAKSLMRAEKTIDLDTAGYKVNGFFENDRTQNATSITISKDGDVYLDISREAYNRARQEMTVEFKVNKATGDMAKLMKSRAPQPKL